MIHRSRSLSFCMCTMTSAVVPKPSAGTPRFILVICKRPTPNVADDAREVRGAYTTFRGQQNQKTKTSNAAISDAANQVAIAMTHVSHTEESHSDALSKRGRRTEPPFIRHFILP